VEKAAKSRTSLIRLVTSLADTAAHLVDKAAGRAYAILLQLATLRQGVEGAALLRNYQSVFRFVDG
jgi:hypothetical protein